MHKAAWLTILWAPAAAAFAQPAGLPVPAPPPPPAATTEQLAAAKAQAGRLIAEAKAQRYFEDATVRAEPRVRHRATGVVCEFQPGDPGARLELVASDAAEGEDFICHSWSGPGQPLTLRVSRPPKPPAMERVLTDMEQSMRDGLADAKPIRLPRPGPASEFIRLQGQRDGVPVVEEAAAVVAGGWLVRLRQTAALDKAGLAVTRGDFAFTRVVRTLSPPAATAPVAPPAATPPSRPPPTPQQIAAARATADRLIAKTGRAALFENATEGAVARVRHKPSGAVCEFGVDDVEHAIELMPPGSREGEGVRCRSRAVTAFTRGLTITRPQPMPSLDQLFETGVAAFEAQQARYGKVAAPGGLVGDMGTKGSALAPGLPNAKAVRYVVSGPGGARFARREVAIIGDWAVMSDFTSTVGAAITDEFLGGMLAQDDFKPIVAAAAAGR